MNIVGNDLRDILDSSIAQSSVKWGMGGGAATSLLGSLSSNDLMVIAGLLFTCFGFVVNTYFQYRRNKRAELDVQERRKREEEEHRLRVQLMEKQLHGYEQ